jgi:integrase
MTGSLRQRGVDSWELRVYLGVDPERGRERWATKTVHGTRRYATACLAEFVEEAGYARLRAGTVSDLLDRWMAQASTAWSASTLRETRSIVEHHLKPHLGHLAVNKLATLDIDDLYQHLLRGGGPEGRGLAPGTVQRVHVVLHRALTQAVRWEWVWLNPARTASPPRVPPAEVQPPSPDQVHRLLAHVEDRDPDFATYLWLAASTGARRSQLLGLRWSEIDIAHAAIGFARAFVEGPTGPVLRATKTHLAYRVAIDRGTIRRLAAHRRRAEARAANSGLHLGGSAFVFSSRPDGSWPWLPNRVTKTFLAHRRDVHVGRFRLHDLRHFMATQMLNAGVPVPTVSDRLGHARASTTLNIYGHCVPGADQAAAQFISTLIARNDDTARRTLGRSEARPPDGSPRLGCPGLGRRRDTMEG